MVEDLQARGIVDKHVLRSMAAIPRHLFVDAALQIRAYGDHALPIGQEQTISQPYMVALMTQALRLTGEEKVLEIGTGSGYQTAILAELADRVFTVERLPAIGLEARARLNGMGYSNIVCRIADGSLGWRELAPFDRVIVTAGAPRVPAFLDEQLRPGGRCVAPVGGAEDQVLVEVVHGPTGPVESPICSCAFVPLIGRDGFVDPSRAG
jgi:protein-L-isoaspartate(D-aspartate) O-methyltransferase